MYNSIYHNKMDVRMAFFSHECGVRVICVFKETDTEMIWQKIILQVNYAQPNSH